MSRACQYYGKTGLLKSIDTRLPLISTGTDQCALVVEGFLPCLMEAQGNMPDGERCPIIAKLLQWRIP